MRWFPARLRFSFSFFFFFSKRFLDLWLLFMHCSINSNRKFWLFKLFFSQLVHIMYCSQTHKFYFSTTFSLKIGLTVLFTHLKIILLQYFLVFSFSFQRYSNENDTRFQPKLMNQANCKLRYADANFESCASRLNELLSCYLHFHHRHLWWRRWWRRQWRQSSPPLGFLKMIRRY